MKDHIVGRYRGFVITARVEPRTIRLLDGVIVRYRVTWSLRRRRSTQKVTEDVADPIMYDSENAALTCVDRRARTFIDAMLGEGVEDTTSNLFPS
jgi:hypothetical protein